MRKGSLRYTNECMYYTDSDSGEEYTFTLNATAAYTFYPGKLTLSNGDPGYPDEYEIGGIKFEVSNVQGDDTDEVIPRGEFKQALDNYCQSFLEDLDLYDWEEYDDSEERDYDY